MGLLGANRRRLNRVGWVMQGVLLAASALWLFSGGSYLLDLLASFQSWVVVACAGGAGLCRLLGARRAAWAGVASITMAAWPIVAGRAVWRDRAELGSDPGPGVLRVVSFNIGPTNTLWREDLERAMSWHADIVVLIEVPVALNRAVRYQAFAEQRGWGWTDRTWVEDRVSACFVLARGTLSRIDAAGTGVDDPDREILLVGFGATGRGEDRTLLGVTHPPSPRSIGRWRLGNAQVERLSAAAVALEAPVVIAADLNGGPASSRARSMRASGFHPSKPLLGGLATFPSGSRLRRVFGVQLDDVWVDPRAYRVLAWSSVAPLGSDHRAVVVDLERIGVMRPGGLPAR